VRVRVPHAAAHLLGPGAHRIDFSIASADGRSAVEEKSSFVVPR
jgi:hypothetical protein